MFAVKGNKQYTIEAREKDAFIADGFDILDENGKVIAEGAGKQIPVTALKAVQAENENLKAENENLKAENENLKAENENLKAENAQLKAELAALEADKKKK